MICVTLTSAVLGVGADVGAGVGAYLVVCVCVGVGAGADIGEFHSVSCIIYIYMMSL